MTNLAIMRLLPKPAGKIEGGQVLFDGQDLLQLRRTRSATIRGRDIAMIFQDPMTSLNPVLTIEEQMVETIQAHRQDQPKDGAAHARDRAARRWSGSRSRKTGSRTIPHQFSGGMRQRVMIAIALALEPKLMIADEPTTALDVTIQAQVLELLRGLTRQTGTALILITHDLGVVAGMTQRINVMYAGYIVETATTLDLFATPSHPYTVGLLHSIPRLDADGGRGAHPDRGSSARPAAGSGRLSVRTALRLAARRCWPENPRSTRVEPGRSIVTTGASATHHDRLLQPATADEAAAGQAARARASSRRRRPGRHRRAVGAGRARHARRAGGAGAGT